MSITHVMCISRAGVECKKEKGIINHIVLFEVRYNVLKYKKLKLISTKKTTASDVISLKAENALTYHYNSTTFRTI